MISNSDLEKLKEIAHLHDKAFWHYHQFDGHSKSGDGALRVSVNFGTVWDRENGATNPRIEVSIYSYVVSTDGDRNHEFESIDDALAAVTAWHAEAMEYNPTADDITEMNAFAAEMWDAIKDKVTIIDLTDSDKES